MTPYSMLIAVFYVTSAMRQTGYWQNNWQTV